MPCAEPCAGRKRAARQSRRAGSILATASRRSAGDDAAGEAAKLALVGVRAFMFHEGNDANRQRRHFRKSRGSPMASYALVSTPARRKQLARTADRGGGLCGRRRGSGAQKLWRNAQVEEVLRAVEADRRQVKWVPMALGVA